MSVRSVREVYIGCNKTSGNCFRFCFVISFSVALQEVIELFAWLKYQLLNASSNQSNIGLSMNSNWCLTLLYKFKFQTMGLTTVICNIFCIQIYLFCFINDCACLVIEQGRCLSHNTTCSRYSHLQLVYVSDVSRTV